MGCLRHGVPVLCEKPPALSLAEFDEIAAVSTASGAPFATVFQHRFGSGGLALRRLADGQAFGPALTAVCHTLWYRPDDYFAVPWRGRWDVEGGGPTMGHGIHQMDLMLAVLGPWREVVAVAARRARPARRATASAWTAAMPPVPTSARSKVRTGRPRKFRSCCDCDRQ